MHHRQIVLDTETTGLDPAAGHRVIEIGGVEILNRRLTGRHVHFYLKPDRAIDPEAQKVHGITDAFLADKPAFEAIAPELLDFVRDTELIIHNAPFDVGFLNHELRRWEGADATIEDLCGVLDTLELARRLHPGQRNSLDALCKRYNVDNSQRELHGALLDAEILARVYLAMTGGQVALGLETETAVPAFETKTPGVRPRGHRPALRVIVPSTAELERHRRYLDRLDASCGGPCLWRRDGVAD